MNKKSGTSKNGADKLVRGIWDHTAAIWSPAHAETYMRGIAEILAMLAQHPEMVRTPLIYAASCANVLPTHSIYVVLFPLKTR